MRRIGLLALCLVLIFSTVGCCYAPGFEGSALWEMRYMLPAEWGGDPHSTVVPEDETVPVYDPIVLTPEQQNHVSQQKKWPNSEFVNIVDYIPDIVIELKYATADNIAGKPIYSFEGAYLRYGTVVKLMQVQAALREKGLSLKIWDAFRPVSAQKVLWAAYPNPTFVANPETGFSNHSRGNTVDVTIVNAAGEEQEMPTGFDEFTSLADRNYSDCTEIAAQNAQMLEDIMVECGFSPLQAEWWHYADTTEYNVENVFDPAVVGTWYAKCNEYINLRVKPDYNSEAIAQIPKDKAFTLLGWDGNFAYIEYQGQRGYVNGDYVKSSL